jgi:hypothetical protein
MNILLLCRDEDVTILLNNLDVLCVEGEEKA